MLKKVWLVKGDLVEFENDDWVLNTYTLFECQSYESALDILRDIENGLYPDIDAVNLCIDYRLESVEEVKENEEESTETYYKTMAFI